MINFSSNWYTLIYLFKHSSILCHILSTILYTHGVIRLSVPYTSILEILRRISGRRLSLTIPVTIPELVNPFLSFFFFFYFFLFLQYIPCLRARKVQIDRLSMRICAQSINESLYRIDTPCFVPFRRITLLGKRRVELNAISLFLFISRIRDAHPVSRCAKHELRELRNNAIFHTHCTYQTLCSLSSTRVFHSCAHVRLWTWDNAITSGFV